MKRIYGLLAALVFTVTAMAQPTPHEKAVLHNDLAKERNSRHAVARDILTGHPQRAKANHRARTKRKRAFAVGKARMAKGFLTFEFLLLTFIAQSQQS